MNSALLPLPFRLAAPALAVLALSACSGTGGGGTETLGRLSTVSERYGDFDSALASAEALVERDPRNLEAKMRLGALMIRGGDLDRAEALYMQAETDHRGSSAPAVGRAQVLLARHDYAGALAAFDRAIARGADGPAALIGSGIALDGLGRHADAQDRYRRILSREPLNAAARNNLGLSLALSGDFSESLAVLEPLAREASALPRHRQNLALAYALAGQEDKARAVAEIDQPAAEVARDLDTLRDLRRQLFP